jgi:iron(III) transport system substrate-binding protein
MIVTRTRQLAVATIAALAVSGCGGASGGSGGAQGMTLYTCTTDTVEQAVVDAFKKVHSGASVDVFRAPTAELNARIAADQRSGGIKADVIWGCDPLTMHGYDSQGLLATWSPPNAADLPASDRTARFAAVDLLYMVIVVHKGTPAPTAWADLAKPAYKGQVALPDPTFAASALGLLGYLSSAPGYGVDFYRKLKDNGAVQMDSPTDVLTAVEQGQYHVGVTLANSAYADQAKGSPINVVWPQPGGLRIYAPIAVTTKQNRSPLAKDFADFAASRAGQKLMAAQDTYVPLTGLGGPPIPRGSPIVAPNWPALFANYRSVLSRYAAIFGG